MWIARLQGGECQQKLGEGWGCISVASMCKALGSILSTIKKKRMVNLILSGKVLRFQESLSWELRRKAQLEKYRMEKS